MRHPGIVYPRSHSCCLLPWYLFSIYDWECEGPWFVRLRPCATISTSPYPPAPTSTERRTEPSCILPEALRQSWGFPPCPTSRQGRPLPPAVPVTPRYCHRVVLCLGTLLLRDPLPRGRRRRAKPRRRCLCLFVCVVGVRLVCTVIILFYFQVLWFVFVFSYV